MTSLHLNSPQLTHLRSPVAVDKMETAQRLVEDAATKERDAVAALVEVNSRFEQAMPRIVGDFSLLDQSCHTSMQAVLAKLAHVSVLAEADAIEASARFKVRRNSRQANIRATLHPPSRLPTSSSRPT